jgi:vancomycin resistance protein VanW
LQGARLAAWHWSPQRWPAPQRHLPHCDGALNVLVHELRVPLQRSDGFAHAALEAGKRANLALAAPAFDGLLLTPERPLSFWRALGRASAQRGFAWGMELRGGCVVPAIAGGLCLLSNALFELAVRSGWTILERHGHSLEAIPPAVGALPLDATVAWPDVDLVLAPRQGAARLTVQVDGDTLRLAAFAAQALDERIVLEHDQRIEQRGGDRFRFNRVLRRRFGEDDRLLASDTVVEDARRILSDEELGKSCLSCGELACRDRPNESVLVSLRRIGR